MAYCIRYDSVPVKQASKNRSIPLRGVIISVAVILVVVLSFVPQVRLAALQLVFPGFNRQALGALDALAGNVARGEPLDRAFHGFCTQVFAQLYE